jgi:hypothetical protein
MNESRQQVERKAALAEQRMADLGIVTEADYLGVCGSGHRSFLRLRYFDPETMLGHCTRCGAPARCYTLPRVR